MTPRSLIHIFFYVIISLATLLKPTIFLNANEVDQVPNQIIVKYKDPKFSPLSENSSPVTDATASDDAPAYKYTPIYPKRNDLVLIEGENIDQLLEELKNDPNVEYVEPNYIKQVYDISLERSDLPNDIDFDRQWALKNSNSGSGADIDFLEALALSRPSSPENPIIIGVIDSKFATNHPDLVNQLWVNEEEIPNNGRDDDRNGYIDDIHGFDFVNQSPDVTGNDDHGSHVAGISAAENNNQIGVSGAFPHVKFIALACSSGGRDISFAAVLQAIHYLVELKIRGYNIVAVNASYGGNVFSPFEYEFIENLSFNDILFCTASGNESWNLDLEKDLNENGRIDQGEDLNENGILEVSYPNSYNLPNIISVASTNRYQQLASSSNYGLTEVDIAAPGDFIYSTASIEDYLKEIQDITLSDGTTLTNQWIGGATNISGDSLSGLVVDCGIGNPGDFPAEVNGEIALIERGTLNFSDKILNAMNAGAIATIIYNNVPEEPNGLRNWGISGTANGPWIPISSFSISQVDGNNLIQALPLNATLRAYTISENPDPNSNYAYLSGTSMASPIVTAAVAFAAHNFPNETMIERRERVLNNVAPLSSLNDKVATGGVVNLRKIVDTDEDNLPDWWEIEHFNTLVHTNAQDNDNDGYTNQEEFLSKTNPMLPFDTPNFKSQLLLDNLLITDTTLEFDFKTYPGYQYQIQSTDSLGNPWQTQATYNGDGAPIKSTISDYIPAQQSQTFYRLEVSE
ncbi:MAG: S8 family serine peptidase [Opitutae bacterium]|nr:S8 family serine peptidase [Opitutae bacterium]